MTEVRDLTLEELQQFQMESANLRQICERSGIFHNDTYQAEAKNNWIPSYRDNHSEKIESFISSKSQNQKIYQNVIILSSQRLFNSLQNQPDRRNNFGLNFSTNFGIINEVEASVSSTLGSQSSFSPKLKKNRDRKKAELKKSNAFKNFAHQFVNFFIQQQNVKDLLQQYNMDQRNYKNMIDNLKKKIIYEKRAQKLKDMISMVNHKNPIYSRILIEACQKFIDVYLKIVEKSKKMKDKDTNRSIEEEIINIINRKLNE